MIGFVPQQYVVEAVYESRFKRQQSKKRNYERMVYESIEDNDERFWVMLDDEIRKIGGFNPFTCRDYRE
jgi:hypothetical protein